MTGTNEAVQSAAIIELTNYSFLASSFFSLLVVKQYLVNHLVGFGPKIHASTSVTSSLTYQNLYEQNSA